MESNHQTPEQQKEEKKANREIIAVAIIIVGAVAIGFETTWGVGIGVFYVAIGIIGGVKA